MSKLDQSIADAVARDGLARLAGADDGSTHVLYLDGSIVRSMEADAWLSTRGPLPTDPTQQEIAAATAAREAARERAAQEAAALRQQILDLAQSAVGVRVDNLTGPQVRALFALTVLRPAGALNAGLIVRPLAEWVQD